MKLHVLPIDRLQVDPDNPRTELDDAETAQLAESIADLGLLEPLRVRPADDSDGWLVTSGQRRLAACRLAGLTVVHCVIDDDRDRTDTNEFVAAMATNTGGRAMSPLDEARGYRRMVDDGDTQTDVARRCGTNQARVSQMLQLLTFPQDVQDAVNTGEMGLSRAVKQHSTNPSKSTGHGLPRGQAARRAVKLGATTAVHVPLDAVQALLGVDEDGLRRLVDDDVLDVHDQTGGIALGQVVEVARTRAGTAPQVSASTWRAIAGDAGRRGMTCDEWLRRALVSLGVVRPAVQRRSPRRYQ